MEAREIFSIIDNETRTSKRKSKKRKWREIEAIEDKYRLKQELSDMDMALGLELDQLSR